MYGNTDRTSYAGDAHRGSRRRHSGPVSHKAQLPAMCERTPLDRSLIDDFSVRLVSQGKSRSTVYSYTGAVRQLAAFLEGRGKDWDDARQLDCEAWLAAKAAEGITPSRRNVCLVAVKTFFLFLEDELWQGSHVSPARKMKSSRVSAKVPAYMGDDVLKAVIESCGQEEDRFVKARDEALLRVLLDTGMRRAEVAAQELDDLNMATRRVMVRGKGGKERGVAFGTRTKMALVRYLKERASHPHSSSSRLWLSKKGPLSPQGVYRIVSARGGQAGTHLYPHRLRRSWATRAQVDVVDLMALAGWSSPEMARRYKSESEAERAGANYSRNSVGDRF